MPRVLCVAAERRGSGRTVLGGVDLPLNTADFPSFFALGAANQSERHRFTNSFTTPVNLIKRAVEFVLTANSAQFAAYVLVLEHVQSITLTLQKGSENLSPANVLIGTRSWAYSQEALDIFAELDARVSGSGHLLNCSD